IDAIAGLDTLAGGSWLGVNDTGVVAGVLNRPGTLGPAPDARSRGELVLEALDHADAVAAATALAGLDPRAYRPFNLVIADNRDAFWMKSQGRQGPPRVTVEPLPEGLSMITAHDRNDESGSARIRHYLPRFRRAAPPDPDAGDWREWEALLASRDSVPEAGPEGAMNIVTTRGFGTVSSSLIALPAPGRKPAARPVWRFATGPSDAFHYADVTL
ncbi:MAG: NRDE family protein, partial [Rhodospirillales bacterium]|nr:NRDE family protein [Rhodospirillales bacterium]